MQSLPTPCRISPLCLMSIDAESPRSSSRLADFCPSLSLESPSPSALSSTSLACLARISPMFGYQADKGMMRFRPVADPQSIRKPILRGCQRGPPVRDHPYSIIRGAMICVSCGQGELSRRAREGLIDRLLSFRPLFLAMPSVQDRSAPPRSRRARRIKRTPDTERRIKDRGADF
jgi:hypothetical protein